MECSENTSALRRTTLKVPYRIEKLQQKEEYYDAGPPRVAYVEPVAVGDKLPNMPLFLKPEFYVPAPLEVTYQTTWQVFPAPLKGLLDGPAPISTGR